MLMVLSVSPHKLELWHTMAITDWPADERPRERLLAQGAAALSDAELLALFLRVGIRGKSAVDLARDLLTHFGNLSAPCNAGTSVRLRGDPRHGPRKIRPAPGGARTRPPRPRREMARATCSTPRHGARLAAPEARPAAPRGLRGSCSSTPRTG